MAERENRRERRDDRRDNRPEETPEFADRLVAINRVSKTVKGGKRFGFAALVVAAERNSWPAEMEAMERQVNILTDALAQAKAEEREACAEIATKTLWAGDVVAKAIRARGETK